MTTNEWRAAFDLVSERIRRHSDFRRLVREVAVAEQPRHPRLSWYELNSMTYGSWCRRGMTPPRVGLNRRARLLSQRIAADLELYPDKPHEAEARVYVEARGFVQGRERG